MGVIKKIETCDFVKSNDHLRTKCEQVEKRRNNINNFKNTTTLCQ